MTSESQSVAQPSAEKAVTPTPQTAYSALQTVMACRPHIADAEKFNRMHDAFEHIYAFIQHVFQKEQAAAPSPAPEPTTPASPESESSSGQAAS